MSRIEHCRCRCIRIGSGVRTECQSPFALSECKVGQESMSPKLSKCSELTRYFPRRMSVTPTAFG